MKQVLSIKSAICYSGFRDGQSPDLGIFPTYEEVKEDLLLLQRHWKSLRMYDCDAHAETVLQVIKNEGFSFDVMLGAYIGAEENNYECPWGGVYPEVQLIQNRQNNRKRIEKLIEMAQAYPEFVSSVSAGNEATVSWTDHMVSVESLLGYVQQLKQKVKQPVTFCENYVPWLNKLKPVGAELDFISIHTYPVWEFKTVGDALHYTIENYHAVAHTYPDKQIVITEAGWTTQSNGRGIPTHHVNEALQHEYLNQLMAWANDEGVLVYIFEAFDESWKGSADPLEPEKHWGLFYANRTPKHAMREGVYGLLAL